MPALSIAAPLQAYQAHPMADFRSYLEHALRDPFTINLKDCSLIEVIRICTKAKSKLHPHYKESVGSLIYNLEKLENEYRVKLYPVQVTDIFWDYFVSFLQSNGLKSSSISTLCSHLRSILNWASKYNATVSPTFTDFNVPKVRSQEIALTADEVSRIAYFDIDLFYGDRRSDYRATMHKIRDMFVLGCNLGQRHSDLVRIEPSCFDRNIFRIVQQKTGNLAEVNIDRYAIEAKTTYRILGKYHFEAPYKGGIGNYNYALHALMKDIGFNDIIRIEDRVAGKLTVENVPKWKMIASHTARRTFATINVLRGHNIHAIKRCTGHTDLRCLEKYIRDDN